MNLPELSQRLREHGIEFIRFEQSDTHGISRSKTVPVKQFEYFAQRGLNFLLGHLGFDAQAQVAPGTGYLEELGFPDSLIRPDFATLQILPWASKTARILCEPYYLDGRPAMAAPRLVVKRVLEALAGMERRCCNAGSSCSPSRSRRSSGGKARPQWITAFALKRPTWSMA